MYKGFMNNTFQEKLANIIASRIGKGRSPSSGDFMQSISQSLLWRSIVSYLTRVSSKFMLLYFLID